MPKHPRDLAPMGLQAMTMPPEAIHKLTPRTAADAADAQQGRMNEIGILEDFASGMAHTTALKRAVQTQWAAEAAEAARLGEQLKRTRIGSEDYDVIVNLLRKLPGFEDFARDYTDDAARWTRGAGGGLDAAVRDGPFLRANPHRGR